MEAMRTRLPAAPIGGIRLVVCDMDGTALNGAKEFSPATLRAFRRLRSAGIGLTIASARTPMMLEVYCAQAGIQDAPIIALEGAQVIDWSNRASLYDRPIDGAQAVRVMEHCHGAGLDYTIYTPRSCYMRRDTQRMWRFALYNKLAEENGLPPVPTYVYEDTSPEAIAGEQVYKVFIDNPTAVERAGLEHFLTGVPGIRTDCSERASVTVMDVAVSKGAALRALAERLGLAPEEICCFGDWSNDLDMLASFPNSVAMGNGLPEAGEAARYITKTNLEDGVAFFLESFVLPGAEKGGRDA